MPEDRTADVSCRVAWAADADAIAGVHVQAWQASYDGVLPEALLNGLDADVLADRWRSLLAAPDDARSRVLVALAGGTVVGFVLTGPAGDPDCDPVADGELTDLTVDPHYRGQGHGTRLMHAAVDTLRADRFTRAVTWLAATDDESRAFWTDAGWDADGAHRSLDLTGDGSTIVKQVRLHTSLLVE